MKKKELKSLHKKDLEEKLSELKKELMKENAQIALGSTPKNPGKVRAVKKMIARVITLLHQPLDAKDETAPVSESEKVKGVV